MPESLPCKGNLKMKTILALILVALVIFVVGAGGCQQSMAEIEGENATSLKENTIVSNITNNTPSQQQISSPTTETVLIKEYKFRPMYLNITKGSTIIWMNQDYEAHTITYDDQSFFKRIEARENFSKTFETPGNYAYHCSIHGERGEITIN